jgi:hypothetical protein
MAAGRPLGFWWRRRYAGGRAERRRQLALVRAEGWVGVNDPDAVRALGERLAGEVVVGVWRRRFEEGKK